MRHRLIIVLTIFAVLGFYAQHTFAAGCTDPQSCMPATDVGHSGGAGGHGCDCPPESTQFSDDGCQATILVKHYRQAMLNPAGQQPVQNDAGLSLCPPGYVSTTYHGRWSVHGINLNQPAISYPVYLQTLALLI